MTVQPFKFVETDSQKIYEEVINALMDGVKEPLYPGDERRIYGEALVMVLVAVYNELNSTAKQKMLRYAQGGVLDAIGERVGSIRLEPSAPYDTFRFTLSAPQSKNILIEAGTRITIDGSVYFATDTAVVIQAGTLSVDIKASCTEKGSQYNGISAGVIKTLVDLIPYIASVVNLNGTTGGDDGEPYDVDGDNRYRERIRLAPATFSVAGPETAYQYYALSVDPDIIDVMVDSPTANVIEIYPLMKGGELPNAEILQKILNAFTTEIRPMTDHVKALSPSQVEYDIELKYYYTLANQATAIQAIEGNGGAIDTYNEWQVSKLGRAITPAQLMRYCMVDKYGKSTGVAMAEITKPTQRSAAFNQVAKFSGKLKISYEIIQGE